jgi:hypothetical protein
MSLSYWDGEMMRDNKRWIIRLEFDRRKNIQTIIIQVESNYEPKQSWLKLSSFNDRTKIAWIKLTQVKLAGVTVISSYPFDPKLPFVKRLMALPHKRVLGILVSVSVPHSPINKPDDPIQIVQLFIFRLFNLEFL